MQFELLIKEIVIFSGTTLIGTSTLQTLISPCHRYWMPDLEKKIDRKILSIFIEVELAKLSMCKDYVSLTFIKSKIK